MKKNKNILLVANYRSDVGYAWWLMENFWSAIAFHFTGRGIKCILIYPKVGLVPEVIKNSPINIIEHDFAQTSFRSVLALIRVILKNKIGYVYLTDRKFYHWLYFVMRLFGVSKFINHDHMPGERSRTPIFKRIVKRMIHALKIFSCDHYIGVSNFIRNRTIQIACVPSPKCSFVHNGIAIFDNNKTTYTHDIFKIPNDSKIVVTTGRANFYKGIDLLIKCAQILIKEYHIENLYFLHVGNGPDLQKFKDMAKQLGVHNKFIFGGFRKDITKILPSCDIGVQVSIGEAFSLSILEYMCAGLATIVPNNCGNSEAVVDGVNGILFTPGNIQELVCKIIYILNNDEFTKKIKTEARKTIVEKFSIEKCNNELLTLLDKQFT